MTSKTCGQQHQANTTNTVTSIEFFFKFKFFLKVNQNF
jgi:hypothetical protein